MGLFKKGLFEAIAFGAGCAVFSAAATAAYGQSATLPQFSDPYGGIAVYTAGSVPAETPKSVNPAAGKTSKSKISKSKTSASKIAAKKPPVAASDLSTLTGTLDDPPMASTSPVAPSATANVPAKDSPLGLGLKWYGANDPYHNAATSTIPATDEIKRDSNQLLGEPSSTGSGVEAGVNLKF